ncbi:MAG TPA: sensor histidine kinase, partial [Bacteroidota bacterium]|nr:sensor histidine kinase [Bacteroidota bacterium]
NNLMIILGLILAEKRQAIRQGHGEAEALSEKFEGRIQGLLEIHQMLSDSGWEPVKISHLADRICKSVLHSFSDGQTVVDLFVGECAITVNSRQAGSLALVFNELIINCMKYAFAGAEGGETPSITIGFAHEQECLRIEFRDNGCGYPETVIMDKRWNVGLRLVHQIIEHTLGGEILLLNSNGALVQIVIDLDEANQ